jgi:UDP-N-acetylmuramyl pentapeptide phosphotransferase/UDP-N-acetylglucosamine-1-phosphate transferase
LIFLTPILSFLGTFALLIWLLKGGRAKFAIDHPNQRSLHASPIPRVGGLALMSGAMIGLLWQWESLGIVALCAVLLMGVSLMDDIFGLSVKWRFLVHGAAAAGFLGIAVGAHWGFVGMAMLFVAMVWMTNLYNFMDGSDGLAGGMALIGFGFYGIAAYMHGNDALSLASASIAASALAFLRFNFHPAKVFMGDAGSIPLGFLAAALGLIGWREGVWPVWFPVMVFSPFIVDASVTLLKRLVRGKKVWQAHREHYYQRLVQMGWGHRNTALLEYGLMSGVGISAWWMLTLGSLSRIVLALVWLTVYFALMRVVDIRWAAFKKINDMITPCN